MELRQVRYFEAVARHLHFTRAAQELYVAQPALSQQIQRLEEELGVVLLERTTRWVRLTDAGEIYLEFSRRVLGEVDDLTARLHDMSEAITGLVDLAATQAVTACGALPALLVEFHEQHPAVEVRLREESGGRS